MPSIYTIEGAKPRGRKGGREGASCKFVGSGRRKRCLCQDGPGRRWKFQKKTSTRCG